FRRFLDNKLEDRERMWNLIQNGPYKSLMIPNPDNDQEAILEPLFKMTEADACKNAKDMWERIKRLMFGSDVTSHVRHSRLMDEFDKFATKEGESLELVYERLTTPVNIMDHNNVRPIPVSISTKFLNCLQPEWSKYVTMELQEDSQEDKLTTAMKLLAREITQKFSTPINNRLRTLSNTRNQAVVHDGRVDIQTKNACYGGNGNRNAGRQNRIKRLMQEIEMMTVIILFSVFHELSQLREKANVQCYNCNEKGHYARNCQKPRVHDAKYFREQMLLAMKDEAGSNLKDEENDFRLDNSYGEETMEELTGAVMLMSRIQPADGNAETVSSYDNRNHGDHISAPLLSATGRTDTASVLHEALGYIKFLQEQVQVLCSPYMKLIPATQIEGQEDGGWQRTKDLQSRGLCLVPVECTLPVAESN
nr:transcription factor bHLH113 isoform X1 [Tanacetum cinerariifolium]